MGRSKMGKRKWVKSQMMKEDRIGMKMMDKKEKMVDREINENGESKYGRIFFIVIYFLFKFNILFQ